MIFLVVVVYSQIHRQRKCEGHTQTFCFRSTNTLGLVATKFLISQLLVVQDKKRTEECSLSQDALLWVWSGTKAVSAWLQFIVDAFSLLANHLSLPQCLDSLPQPSKTNTHATLQSKRACPNSTWTIYHSKIIFKLQQLLFSPIFFFGFYSDKKQR